MIQIEQLQLLHKELQKNIQFLVKRFALCNGCSNNNTRYKQR